MHATYPMKFALGLVCAGLLGCATEPRTVVVSTIESTRGWSMDAAQYLTYNDSLTGLNLLLSARVIPAQLTDVSQRDGKPLRIRVLIDASYDATEEVKLEPIATTLEVAGKIFRPSTVQDCQTAATIDSTTSIVIKSKEGSTRGALCILVSYDAPRPSDWSTIVLRVGGLKTSGKDVTVPNIHYTIEQRYIARCGTPAGNGGLFCSYED